jgi:LmbE family N-acetylglucosaminyl deacetylase
MGIDLLLIVAHPDDESFGTGGTLAEYAQKGRKTALITLTKGSSGRSLGLCEPDVLPEFRAAELRKSVEALSISDFTQYDYPDASPVDRIAAHASSTPAEFVGGLMEADREEVVARVMRDLERLQPEIVITFAPDGGNRHPDHIASHQITYAALERGGHFERGVRLYYFANPTLINPAWADTWQPPTHYRDVTPYLPAKFRSMAAHRTQAFSVLGFLERLPERIPLETFRRAVPKWDSEEHGSDL